MTFEEKVKFIRAQPKFKVIPISEVKAIAFAAREIPSASPDQYIIGLSATKCLILYQEDVEKILRAYPDLEPKFLSSKA